MSEQDNQHSKFHYPIGTKETFHEERPRKPLKTPVRKHIRWRTIPAGLVVVALVLLGVGYIGGVVHQGIRARESSDLKIAQVRAEFEDVLQRELARQAKTPFRAVSSECQLSDGYYACGAVKPQTGRE